MAAVAAAAAVAEQSFQIVVAATKQLGIGKAGSMPWKLPGDMVYFKRLTSTTADPQKMNAVVRAGGAHHWQLKCLQQDVKRAGCKLSEADLAFLAQIMGRKTWDSIPRKFQPLPDRVNVVLSRGAENQENDGRQGNGVAQRPNWSAAKGVHVSSSLESALGLLSQPELCAKIETVFVIGGGQVPPNQLHAQHVRKKSIVFLGYIVKAQRTVPRLASLGRFC